MGKNKNLFLRVRDKWSGKKPDADAAQYLESALDQSFYGSGQIETVCADVEALKKALPILVKILFEKGAITREEVMQIAGEK